MQELKTNVTIKIPEDYVLVEKTEYNELVELANPTWATGIKWLSNQTGGRSAEWLRDNVLLLPENIKVLEEFVSYPENSGEPWGFHIKEMKNWLNKKSSFKRAHKQKTPSAKGAKKYLHSNYNINKLIE